MNPLAEPVMPKHASAEQLASRVREFVDSRVLPCEVQLNKGGNEAREQLKVLSRAAREGGLRGMFYPAECGGRVASLEEYLPVAEEEGRTEFSQTLFASHSALDAHMLLRFASGPAKQQFLEPLIRGEAIPSYGMTEPDHCGSLPAHISTRARLDNGEWVIQGKKWFICNTGSSHFVTVLVRTDSEAAPGEALSMILVPTDSPGFEVNRSIAVMGRQQGQGEMHFNAVRVPEHNILGAPGEGVMLMRSRLGMGRVLRAAHWVGLARRSYELMLDRLLSDRCQRAGLARKQLVRKHVYDVHEAIISARHLLREAARLVDLNAECDVEVNMAKVAASHALCLAADSAVQIYGAEGVSDESPLSGIYRTARTTRILDGSDEALISSVGRQLIERYAQQ